MRYICKLVLLLVLSGAVHGQTQPDPNQEAQRQVERFFKGDFVNQQGDRARNYLVTLFGQLNELGLEPTVRMQNIDQTTSGNKLIPFLFKIFNLGILAITSTILVYSSVFSLSGAANEGGAIGSGRVSGWTLGRVTTSFAVLIPIPKFKGYSLIQLVVLKVVLAGSAVANLAWLNVLEFMQDSGGPVQQISSKDSRSYLLEEDKFFDVESVLSPTEVEEGSENGPLIYTIVDGSKDWSPKSMYVFNQLLADSLNVIRKCGACICRANTGGLTRLNLDFKMKNKSFFLTYNCEGVNKEEKLFEYEFASNSPDFQAGFKPILNRYIENVANDLKDYIILSPDSEVVSEESNVREIGRVITKHFKTFYRNTSILLKSLDNNDLRIPEDEGLKDAKRDGWVHAGLHLEYIGPDSDPSAHTVDVSTRLEGRIKSLSITNYHVDLMNIRKLAYLENKKSDQSTPTGIQLDEFHKHMSSFLKSGLKQYYIENQPAPSAPAIVDSLKSIRDNALIDFSNKINNGRDYQYVTDSEKSPMAFLGEGFKQNVIFEKMVDMSKEVIKTLKEEITSGTETRSPIQMLQKIGKDIIGHSLTYFNESITQLATQVEYATTFAFGISSGSKAALAVIKSFQAHNKNKSKDPTQDLAVQQVARERAGRWDKIDTFSGTATQVLNQVVTIIKASATSLLKMYLPIANSMGVVYLVTGVILGAYVPFIPTLIYVFSILAWLGAVIEAMLASPIIAVGFANPDGHEFLGKSEQALMLMLGVFLRPLLTVIGLVVSVTIAQELTRVFINVLLGVLPFFVNNISEFTVVSMFSISAFCLLFSYSMMVILEQCYSLIFAIPDRVLKWVGGPQDMAGSSISQVLNSASGGLTSQSSQAAQGLSSASNKIN